MEKLFANKFLRASSLVYLGSLGVNLLNYIFNLVIGRILVPEQFGEIAAIFSLTFILGVPATALGTTIAKYVAEKKSLNETSLIASIYTFVTTRVVLFSLLILVLYEIFVPFLSQILKIPHEPLIIFGFYLPFSFLTSLNNGTLQGMHSFGHFSISNILVSVGKLILGVLFVKLGYGVSGVITAVVLGSTISYFYGLVVIYLTLPKNKTKQLLTYSWKGVIKRLSNILLATLFLALFMNIDVILAKSFLTDYLAGQYASLSVVSKIISYGSLGIIAVLVPLAASSKTTNNSGRHLLLISLTIVTLISLPLLLIFTFFPTFIIGLLFGSKYILYANLLWIFALTAFLTTISSLIVNYFLAITNHKFQIFLIVSVVLELILIFLFHENIKNIIFANLITSIFLTLILFFQTLQEK